MKIKPAEPLLSYWYRALSSTRGIELICSDPEQVRNKLYAVRAGVHDPDLDQISACLSPFDPAKLWLVKRNPTNATP